MKVKELAERLSLLKVTDCGGEREIDGAYTGDLLSWVMGRAKSGNVWVTIMSNINVVAVASLCDVSMVIIAEGSEIGEDTIEKAKTQDIGIYSSKMTSYELCSEIGKLI